MSRPLVVVICLSTAMSPVLAQQVLVSWEFNKDGDTEGWFPAHSLAPFVVQGGTLKTSVTAGDPYMHASPGHSFDLEANDFQYIELRMRHTDGKHAEFFWAATTEGKDAGFVAGKERGFPCVPDGQWHVYHVYPLWQGRITRLRFDPPEKGEVEIDYIRIIQGEQSTHDPKSPEWNFIGTGAGWVASSGGTHLTASTDGARTQLTSERLVLVGPRVDLKASDYRYALLQLQATGPLTAGLYWASTDDANFPACNMETVDVPAGPFSTNLYLLNNPMYGGDIKRLQLTLEGVPGTTVMLKKVALAPVPLGPPRFSLISFASRDALVPLGRPGLLVARYENLGGAELRDIPLRVRVVSGKATLAHKGLTTVPLVAPGYSGEATWTFEPTSEGRLVFRLEGPHGLTAETEVVASRTLPQVGVTSKLTAQVQDGVAWIGNDRIMLTLLGGPGGFARARLDALQAGKTHAMALLPHLGALSLAGQKTPAELTLSDAKAKTGESYAELSLNGNTMFGQARVSLTLTFRLKQGKPYIDCTYTLSTDRTLKVTAFRGPWLWVGEGSFGDKQDLALFPGSEYLVEGERSSSTLDIAPPKNVRFAPHPNTVTVPSMAVECDGALVGLMWDPLQKWDGKNQKPTAVFASPNFVESHMNHLLGLCLPSIPDWMKPNELLAATPYELKPGARLTLAASLYAEVPSDVLRSMELYFDRFGIPALPPKPRSYEDTVAMSLKSYEDILWVEQAKGWMGVIGWSPSRSQEVALNYVVASRLLKDRAWAKKLTDKGLSLADPTDLHFALHGYGNPCDSLAQALAAARVAARRVPEDGKYTFRPATDAQKALGAEGSTAVGICARAVRPVLDQALLTGDLQALQAALRTLKFMEQFKVPRASQVWEVPVHTPDILASADACEVYLMAYKLTGDQDLLKRAVYWARTGLPFVYVWQAPEQRDLMKGSSIPVFGATYYTGSWFARPVQWNGLEYARVLLELARYDDSLPWRHFAEMITISGMNQQSTREKDYGTYPDNWELIDDIECTGCMLAPGRIMLNALQLMESPSARVRTEVLHTPDGPMCLTSAPAMTSVEWRDGVLTASLRYDAGMTAYAVLMPAAEPEAIEVDGVNLERREAPIAEAEGWSYTPRTGCVMLKLKYGEAARKVRIVGVRRITPQLPIPRWEFERPGGAEGWTAAHDVAPLEVRDGNLFVTVTGGDPYIVGPGIAVDATEFPGLVFRAKATRPDGQVFFGTDAGGFAPERSRAFTLPADGQFHEVRVDLRDHPEWKGLIHQLRLDFASAPCEVAIDWIRMLE